MKMYQYNSYNANCTKIVVAILNCFVLSLKILITYLQRLIIWLEIRNFI